MLFSPEIIKIDKVEKLDTNLHDKTEYVIHIRTLKEALNHGLILENVNIMVKLNQNAWLKPYIDMDTKFFTENLLATEMRKTQILMNEPIYLGLAILHLSKTVMYEF